MLQIVVCVKAVPDPKEAGNLKIDPVTKTLVRCSVPMVLNPLDKHALEAALQIKAETEADICVLSMGPPEAGSIVKECMALGADKGILLSDPGFGGADAYATAFKAMGIENVKTFLKDHPELKVFLIFENDKKELETLGLNGFPEE